MIHVNRNLRMAIVILMCVAIVLCLFFYLPPTDVARSTLDMLSSPTSQVAVIRSDDLPFPVKYSEAKSPEKLTSEQAQKIFRIAKACQSPAQPIWYVEVHCNERIDGNPDLFCSSTVFFRPQPTTSRLREFNALYIDGSRLRYYKISLANSAPSKDANLPKPYQCVQVASADGKFYDDPAMLPRNMEPFVKPDGIRNEDVIELVDFIRSSPELSEAAPEPVTRPTTSSNDPLALGDIHFRYPNKVEGGKAITRIQKSQNGSVEIDISIRLWPDHSEGQNVICAKKGEKWIVQSISLTGVWFVCPGVGCGWE